MIVFSDRLCLKFDKIKIVISCHFGIQTHDQDLQHLLVNKDVTVTSKIIGQIKVGRQNYIIIYILDKKASYLQSGIGTLAVNVSLHF